MAKVVTRIAHPFAINEVNYAWWLRQRGHSSWPEVSRPGFSIANERGIYDDRVTLGLDRNEAGALAHLCTRLDLDYLGPSAYRDRQGGGSKGGWKWKFGADAGWFNCTMNRLRYVTDRRRAEMVRARIVLPFDRVFDRIYERGHVDAVDASYSLGGSIAVWTYLVGNVFLRRRRRVSSPAEVSA